MNLTKTLYGVGIIMLLLGFASCGGGSGGGGDAGLQVSGSSFGFSGLFGNTSGSGTSNEYPILSFVNIPVVVRFTEPINPSTVNHKSIDIKTIDVPEEQDPEDLVKVPGGIQATVEFIVSGSDIYIYPKLSFHNGEANWGFVPNAAYEISFTQPPAKDVVTSVYGNQIQIPLGKPIAFITSEKVYDQFPGVPEPTFFYEDGNGVWVKMADENGDHLFDEEWDENDGFKDNTSPRIPITEPNSDPPKFTQRLRVYFSEPVLLSYYGSFLVNTSDHTSDALKLRYYDDFPKKHFPIPVPGLWFLTQSTLDPEEAKKSELHPAQWTDTSFIGESYVEFIPNEFLMAIPPDELLYFLAKGVVADLSGNTKGAGAEDITTAVSEGTVDLGDIEENFSDSYNEDTSTSSAIWGEYIKPAPGSQQDGYYLAAGGGGGTGQDGKFYPPNFIPEILGPDEVDLDHQIIYLPTAFSEGEIPNRVWKHYEYNFTSITIPYGWLVKAKELELDATDTLPDRLNLAIFATGTVNISGTLDVSGGKGLDGAVGLGPDGTLGGESFAGGARGGQGGSIPSGGDNLIINGEKDSDRWKAIDYEWNGVFGMPDPGTVEAEIVGITGVSTDLGDFYLEDTTADFRSIESTIVGQLLQPNVGMGVGGERVVHNHATFYIEKVDDTNDNKIWVYSDPVHPLYRGKLNQPSENPYIPVPPIAKSGDPYMLGSLKGFDGSSSTLFGTGGVGGDPLTVAQTLLTLAAAGGGGGGSSTQEGSQGEDGPNFDITQGGNSTPETQGGLGGAMVWDQILEEYVYKGVVTGTIFTVIGDDELVLTFDDPDFSLEVGMFDGKHYRINPNTKDGDPDTTNDWIFEIASNTADSVMVLPVGIGDNLYYITDPEVGVQPNVPFILYPPDFTGGSGGGGSGIELTGTYKTTYQPPYQLPRWLNGAGGGSGGGAVIMESAHGIQVTASGSILARGGMGGSLSGFQVHLPSGGGGSGGSIILRSRDYIQVQFGGVLSADGGLGRDDPDTVPVVEGKGGPGLVRLETKENDLLVSNFSNNRTIPELQEIDLGQFVPLGQESLGLSYFYPAGIIVPDYRSVKIVYQMWVKEPGEVFILHEGLEWYANKIWNSTSNEWEVEIDGTYEDPPFIFDLNQGVADEETGYLNPTMITEDFVDAETFLLGSDDAFFRFKIRLWNNETTVGSRVYRDPKIDTIIVSRVQEGNDP